ncbi:MAG: tripartite tricarboxylate transporter substrate binding protein [Proteobacteria bacterium]|nr:tripartite tricarboxylate transporter substrate binding protein [Pseudomonadota bacterium]
MRKRLALMGAAVFLLGQPAAHAAWPEKPITVTVGFGAGGTTDVVARAVAELVSRKLGQPVVVENRAGAGGAVAATALTKQPADGYNLVATTSTTITLDPQVTKLGFGIGDFTYVAATGEFPEAFIALPKSGWKTLKDAIEASKTSGGKTTYASSTSLDRMITAVLGKKTGLQFVPVPTRSGAEVVTQVMGGHTPLGYSSGAYYPQAKSGEVKALAVLGEKRLKGLPDVPTLKELGYGLSSVNLILFVAPKDLPADVAKPLYAAFAAAAADPSIIELMEKRSLNDFVATGDELAKTIASQSEGFKQLLEASK